MHSVKNISVSIKSTFEQTTFMPSFTMGTSYQRLYCSVTWSSFTPGDRAVKPLVASALQGFVSLPVVVLRKDLCPCLWQCTARICIPVSGSALQGFVSLSVVVHCKALCPCLW